MTEATHTSEALYGLGRALGRGPRLWAGLITVSDAETIDTGLDVIEGVGSTVLEAAGPTDTGGYAVIASISGGTITFGTGQLATAATPVTDMTLYLLVAGAIR